MGDSQTLFEKISKSERSMAEFMESHALDCPCVVVCKGECNAVSGFNQSSKEACIQNIMRYLSTPPIGDDAIE